MSIRFSLLSPIVNDIVVVYHKIVSAYDEYLLFLEKMGFWLPGPGLVNKIATIYRPALCHP